MLDLSLFKRPAMVGVSLGSFTLSASIFAMFLYLTLYLQEVLGYGPFAGRAPLPADHHALLRGRPHRRQAHRPGPVAVPARARPPAGRPRLRPDDPRAGRLDTGRCCSRASSSPASGSASPTRCSPRPRSRWSRPERSGMASGSASTFRQVGHRDRHRRPRGGVPQPDPAEHVGGARAEPGGPRGAGPRRLAADRRPSPAAASARRPRRFPVAAVRNALIGAYKVGFAETFNHLMIIATVIAAIGAVGSLVLVRQRDFVPSSAPVAEPVAAAGQPPAGSPAGAEVTGPTEPEVEPVPDSDLPHDPLRRRTRTPDPLAGRRHR